MPPPAEQDRPRHSRAVGALKWFTILYALLLGLELSLLFILGLGNPILYGYDDACGYFPEPGQHVRRFFATNQTNSFGMRSPEIARQKSPGTLRLLFVGDSVTYGTTYVDQSKIFTSLLAQDLPLQLHRPVEVLNASAGGWAVSNELGFLKSRGGFDSDVVVFVINTGDLVQPMNRSVLSLAGGYPDHRPPFALVELWVRYIRPRVFQLVEPADAGSVAERPDPVTQTPPVLAALDEARQFARDHGAEFRLVYTPARGGEWESVQYARAFEMLREWAARSDVPLLDLSADLSSRPLTEVYQDSIHLRPLGNAIVAHAIESNWLWPEVPRGNPPSRADRP